MHKHSHGPVPPDIAACHEAGNPVSWPAWGG